jgi:drug/metabolite transporter (DMT)-like permease
LRKLSETGIGVFCALLAAVLFGASAPFAKSLLGNASPQGLAGLLYLGSGVGLTLVRATGVYRSPIALKKKDLPWLAAAVLAGGAVAPVLLMEGLQRTPASVASLLLNLEVVFTAMLAWVLFGERFSGRVAIGLSAVVAGGILLGWEGSAQSTEFLGATFVALACLAWGLDNNLTQRISQADPVQITMIKGLAAGTVNTVLALGLHSVWPSRTNMLLAAGLGFLGYGVSLALFVMALRRIGTTRTIASFGIAPFVGTVIGVVVFGEPLTMLLVGAGVLMAAGVWITATSPRR